MRPLVSYEDISVPQTEEVLGQRPSFSKPPPSKKRRRSSLKITQHWDDPGYPDEVMNYDEDVVDGCAEAPADVTLDGEALDAECEESRELTYDEIWDDSALIDAWNAATEEYETHHGGEKDWKKELVHKSPLWYNVPPPVKKKPKVQTQTAGIATKSNIHVDDASNDADGEELNSHPLDFDTFVPTHDPSLDIPVPPHPPSGPGLEYLDPVVSKDEAFSRALGAMYWGGYWTAVYHCQAKRETQKPTDDEIDEHHNSVEIRNRENAD